jgi:EAL domain-containing protein (putative c-di-GMP-specific phosphodiesterase class I)
MAESAELVGRFRVLLETRALEFRFQPIIDVTRATVLGYEALMRGPAGTVLQAPDELMRLARMTGRMAELERQACLGAIDAFARLDLPGKLFLNLSAPMIEGFARDQGGEMLRRAVDAGIAPGRLVLELTEHERVEDVAGLRAAMVAMSGLGVTLAIDDFGDGRSSLRLWAQLNPQIVKLDKYFVHDLHRDSRKVEVIRAVLRLAEALGTPLVAEGIEHPGELAVLRDLGCHYAQGYLIGRPSAAPPIALPPEVLAVLHSGKIAVLPNRPGEHGVSQSIERLMVSAPAASTARTGGAFAPSFRSPPLRWGRSR